MICTHNDCFTCPYGDCISNKEPEKPKAKKGRKKMPPEEKSQRKKLKCKEYYEQHKEKYREYYLAKTEGKVKHRYRSKNCDLQVTE